MQTKIHYSTTPSYAPLIPDPKQKRTSGSNLVRPPVYNSPQLRPKSTKGTPRDVSFETFIGTQSTRRNDKYMEQRAHLRRKMCNERLTRDSKSIQKLDAQSEWELGRVELIGGQLRLYGKIRLDVLSWNRCQRIHPSVYRRPVLRLTLTSGYLFLSFDDDQHRDQWFVHLSPRTTIYRRLELKILDTNIQERDVLWELIIDDTIMSRSTSKSDSFWGETFTFEDLPEVTTCYLRLYKSGKMIGGVPLPLLSDFTILKDERYLIVDPEPVGEVRLCFQYQEVEVVPTPPAPFDLDTLYLIQAILPIDLFCRTALVENRLLPFLIDMCTREVQTSGDTLFRSNTLLTKTLEATMRLLCQHFLSSSIGPTVSRILEGEVKAEGSAMLGLVQGCWSDMYLQRHTFPGSLRTVFAHIYKVVKEVHTENLRYKAVSSFVFLRLICPALLSPHLFGLADGLPPTPVQRTLTTLAKILHALAFFSDRDPELAPFTGFIKENSETMIDYLTSFTIVKDSGPTNPTFRGELQMTPGGPINYPAELSLLSETLYQRGIPNDPVLQGLQKWLEMYHPGHLKTPHTKLPLHVDTSQPSTLSPGLKVKSPSSWRWFRPFSPDGDGHGGLVMRPKRRRSMPSINSALGRSSIESGS